MKKTIILAQGREIKVKLKDEEKFVTPAVMYTGEMGVGFFYSDQEGNRKGAVWGLFIPQLPINSFRAMKILEQIKDITDPGLLAACWYAARVSVRESDEKRKIKNLLGQHKLSEILTTPMKEAEINSLLINLCQINNGFYDHPFSEIEEEMNAGFFPKTEIVERYLKNELKPDLILESQDTKPSFKEVMEFNKNIWPLFREKFVNGEFTRQDALNFLRI